MGSPEIHLQPWPSTGVSLCVKWSETPRRDAQEVRGHSQLLYPAFESCQGSWWELPLEVTLGMWWFLD